MLSAEDVEGLLSTLCVELGFCLPPGAIIRRKKTPPPDVDLFSQAVFVAEGVDPRFADPLLYAQVRKIVEKAFARGHSFEDTPSQSNARKDSY